MKKRYFVVQLTHLFDLLLRGCARDAAVRPGSDGRSNPADEP
jgi:hypothetical protein